MAAVGGTAVPFVAARAGETAVAGCPGCSGPLFWAGVGEPR